MVWKHRREVFDRDSIVPLLVWDGHSDCSLATWGRRAAQPVEWPWCWSQRMTCMACFLHFSCIFSMFTNIFCSWGCCRHFGSNRMVWDWRRCAAQCMSIMLIHTVRSVETVCSLDVFFCLSKTAILRLNSSTPSDDFLLMCQDNSGVAFLVFQKRPNTNPQSYQKGLPCHAIIPTSSTYNFPSFLWIGFSFKAYKMKVMSVVGKGYKSLVRAIEPGDVAGISSPRLSCQNAKG